MEYSQAEILQTVAMTEMEHLDIRTVTLGLSLRDCASETIERPLSAPSKRSNALRDRLVSTVDEIGDEIGIRIANKRIAITPVSMITEGASGNPVIWRAQSTNRRERWAWILSAAIPRWSTKASLATSVSFSIRFRKLSRRPKRLCLGKRRDHAGRHQHGCSARSVDHDQGRGRANQHRGRLACAKFVCFANAVEDNPFMAGAFHGIGEPEAQFQRRGVRSGSCQSRGAACR
jgi:uncharacterized protein (UPF0210 family)